MGVTELPLINGRAPRNARHGQHTRSARSAKTRGAKTRGAKTQTVMACFSRPTRYLSVWLTCVSLGCESKVVIASFSCPESSESTTATNGGTGGTDPPFAIPWSTGFEDGFCDYSNPGGFCYETGPATHTIVSEPTHSGNFAAAMTVRSDGVEANAQTRCVRGGTLPTEAYYGVWYYLPIATQANDLWNLIHFQGGEGPNNRLHGLWDVSLVNNDQGDLRLYVYDFLGGTVPDMSSAPPVPVGSWFHIEVFLKRATDETGEFILYQDGAMVVHLTDLITDDSPWGQWYVGNLALDLTPAESTIYIDDVTISSSR